MNKFFAGLIMTLAASLAHAFEPAPGVIGVLNHAVKGTLDCTDSKSGKSFRASGLIGPSGWKSTIASVDRFQITKTTFDNSPLVQVWVLTIRSKMLNQALQADCFVEVDQTELLKAATLTRISTDERSSFR